MQASLSAKSRDARGKIWADVPGDEEEKRRRSTRRGCKSRLPWRLYRSKRVRFWSISEDELEEERVSTQISGARSNRTIWAMFSVRPGASQATSTALTPAVVETGHSDSVSPWGRSLQEAVDTALAPAMKGSRRRTHKDVAVLIGLNVLFLMSLEAICSENEVPVTKCMTG